MSGPAGGVWDGYQDLVAGLIEKYPLKKSVLARFSLEASSLPTCEPGVRRSIRTTGRVDENLATALPRRARNRVEGDGGEPPRRSKIDLNHGFLRQIQRNQRDRKAYHEAWEEAREQTADANKREYGIGINVMKDGKEWKKPQQWRSFEREGGARDGDDRGPDRRDGERRPPRDDRRDDSDGDDDLRSRLTHDEVHERTAAALRSAESRREPAKARRRSPSRRTTSRIWQSGGGRRAGTRLGRTYKPPSRGRRRRCRKM